jgi:hypothetical protein
VRRPVIGWLLVAAAFAGCVTAFVAFAVPVSSETYGSCGMAGTWALAAVGGDPTGPQDHPEMYADYVACAAAARDAVRVMHIATAVALLAGLGLALELRPGSGRQL